MVAIELDFPGADIEKQILLQETSLDEDTAVRLMRLGQAIRQLEHEGLPEVASTRTLVSAAKLIGQGVSPLEAAGAAIAGALTDDPMAAKQLLELTKVYMA